ncbi:PP2C family protein-serine/threonine phosphatase [Kitasatospora sp. NPDC048298]|uniref:PP2C family protein-serine/threonine phosphatase n=1 Tax=Kitasatospora sp. NPDC048298 TaxID=3364049 RepID=UPI003719DA20
MSAHSKHVNADGSHGPLPPLHLPRRTRMLLWAALLVLVGAVAADVLAGPGVTLTPMLAVTPMVSAPATRNPRVPLATGAVAAVMAVLIAYFVDVALPISVHVASLLSIVAASLASAATVALMASRERELFHVRNVAEAAQRALLRPPPERIGQLRIAVRYTAAAAESRIGGDLYEVTETAYGVRILLGDVQGHGLAAVETAADVLGAFRAGSRIVADLAQLAERMDRIQASHAMQERFVTALLLEVPPTGPAKFVNCGHPPPLLRRAGRVVELKPPAAAPPLGLRHLAGGRYQAGLFEPRRGDLLLLHTDGVSEARDRADRFYPLAERLAALRASAPEDLLDLLLADVGRWAEHGLTDDAALLALRWDR